MTSQNRATIAIGIAALLFVDIALSVVAIWWSSPVFFVHDWLVSSSIGLYFALPSVWAVFATLGPYRFGWWFHVCFALTMATAVTGGAFVWRLDSNSGEILLFFIMIIVQWIVVQIPLWLLRRFAGWRLGFPGEAAGPSHTEVQFTIGQLMGWTATVACFLACCRWLLPLLGIERFDDVGAAILFAVILVCNVLVAIPTVCGGLARRAKWMALWLGMAVPFVGILAYVEPRIASVFGPVSMEPGLWLFMNASQFVVLAANLLVVRLLGVHLVSVARR